MTWWEIGLIVAGGLVALYYFIALTLAFIGFLLVHRGVQDMAEDFQDDFGTDGYQPRRMTGRRMTR
jgi:hypothetical protein